MASSGNALPYLKGVYLFCDKQLIMKLVCPQKVSGLTYPLHMHQIFSWSHILETLKTVHVKHFYSVLMVLNTISIAMCPVFL